MKRLFVKVTTRAPKNEITECEGDFLKIKITAPPAKGKANKELIKFLARHFKIAQSAISIIKGEKSRNKVIGIGE